MEPAVVVGAGGICGNLGRTAAELILAIESSDSETSAVANLTVRSLMMEMSSWRRWRAQARGLRNNTLTVEHVPGEKRHRGRELFLVRFLPGWRLVVADEHLANLADGGGRTDNIAASLGVSTSRSVSHRTLESSGRNGQTETMGGRRRRTVTKRKSFAMPPPKTATLCLVAARTFSNKPCGSTMVIVRLRG
ncbi:hypothetical protein OH76DRAFT_1419635 [Lentinus brumalis]|uniref:Uncharacterized protein n=1 Tax=Lentinus brumalis TaxID=2498619 RepID=A0A371D4B3_9APHY|nr:hypothetical protein OH76DRAFT_1419635 [Polyporus brumalis]